MSHWHSDSTLRSFDPFATHSFTAAVSHAPPEVDGVYQGGGAGSIKASAAATASLPSPPPSPSYKPMMGYDVNEDDVNIPIPDLRLGPMASYNHHVERAMKAPPQTILAIPNVPAPSSWPDVNGLSTTPLSMSSSPPSSSSSSSSSVSQSPAPYSHPPYPSGRQPSDTHVFNDFRAEVERYRQAHSLESDDLPVLKKKRDRVYAGF